MRVRRHSTAVVIDVPCKVNLFLEVLAKRPDGFHEIETLMATAGPCDTLALTPSHATDIEFACRWGIGCEGFGNSLRQKFAASDLFGELPKTADNLAWRALDLLRRTAGIEQGAKVQLVKRIPAAAGLGGASADAAAALVAGNLGWGLNWSSEQLMELAAQLGSDVPFFLGTAAAICRGRGEKIEPIGRLRRRPLVVVRPTTGLSTPQVYKHCRPQTAIKSNAQQCVESWNGEAKGVSDKMLNRLEEPARQLSAEISQIGQRMHDQDAVATQMSGSGSSFFAVARSARQARRIAGRWWCQGLGSATMGFSPAVE